MPMRTYVHTLTLSSKSYTLSLFLQNRTCHQPFSFEMTAPMSACAAILAGQQAVAKRHDVFCIQYKFHKRPLKLDNVWPLGANT